MASERPNVENKERPARQKQGDKKAPATGCAISRGRSRRASLALSTPQARETACRSSHSSAKCAIYGGSSDAHHSRRPGYQSGRPGQAQGERGRHAAGAHTVSRPTLSRVSSEQTKGNGPSRTAAGGTKGVIG